MISGITNISKKTGILRNMIGSGGKRLAHVNGLLEHAWAHQKLRASVCCMAGKTVQKLRGDNKRDHSPCERAFIQLSGSIAGMTVCGLGHLALASCAPQVPLAALLGLTWGSFRWNENEIWEWVSSTGNAETEMGKVFKNNRLAFAIYFSLLLSFYALVYAYARRPVNQEMINQAKAQIASYQPSLVALAFHHFSMRHQQCMQTMSEDSRAVFNHHLETLGKAIEQGDQETATSSCFALLYLLNDTHVSYTA